MVTVSYISSYYHITAICMNIFLPFLNSKHAVRIEKFKFKKIAPIIIYYNSFIKNCCSNLHYTDNKNIIFCMEINRNCP